MNKLLPFLAFSILLLVPVGAQEVFANHPTILGCPPPGVLINDPDLINNQILGPFCQFGATAGSPPPCPAPYSPSFGVFDAQQNILYLACTATPQQIQDTTHPDQCQGASILVNNHCFAQALNNLVGGELLGINTLPLLVGAIGTNPIITGLVGITIAGVTGQAVWFVHRRKKSKDLD